MNIYTILLFIIHTHMYKLEKGRGVEGKIGGEGDEGGEEGE